MISSKGLANTKLKTKSFRFAEYLIDVIVSLALRGLAELDFFLLGICSLSLWFQRCIWLWEFELAHESPANRTGFHANLYPHSRFAAIGRG